MEHEDSPQIKLAKMYEVIRAQKKTELKVGDTITAYEKGYHEYLGGACTYLPSEESWAAAYKKWRDGGFCNHEQMNSMSEEVRAKNEEYFGNINTFAIKHSRHGIPKDDWHVKYYREQYGITGYSKTDKENFDLAYYRRIFSSEFKPSKGSIKVCCISYCNKVDIQEEIEKRAKKLEDALNKIKGKK